MFSLLAKQLLRNSLLQKNTYTKLRTIKMCRLCSMAIPLRYTNYDNQQRNYTKVFLVPAGLLSFLSPKDPEGEETPEEKLIMTIKRSILCIQREQYAKAEQMLHLALRMAQDLQNKDGITFVYDVMANLAMTTEQYSKAEKLFVNVMQRLLQDGHKEDDIKVNCKFHLFINILS